MKRILTITLFILFVLPAISQVSPPSPQSRVAGRFVASNYGQWSLPIYSFPAGTGSLTFTLSSSTVRLPDGRLTMPFNTNAPIRVGSETVTPSAVGAGCILNSTVIGGCSITATFSNAHSTSDQVLSATFGLQEALNDAGKSGGGAVTIDSAWTNAGGTTGIKNAATLPSNTGIEDVRTGAISGGTGTVTSVTFTGDGVVDSSTPSSAVTTSGTVTATIKTQTANTILAGPTTGSAANAAFRALVSADIPNNAANTTGTSGGLSGSPAITVSSCTGCSGGGGYPAAVTVTVAPGSPVTEVDLTSCITSSYKDYEIRYRDMVSTTANSFLVVQFSTNNGSTYDTGTTSYWGQSRYGITNNGASSTFGQNSLGANGLMLSYSTNAASPMSEAGRFTVFDPLNTVNYKEVQGMNNTFIAGTSDYGESIVGEYQNTSAVNALRFYMGGTNTFSGSFTCQPLPQ